MTKRVLVLCTGNSCRSIMAEGILKSLDLDAASAGSTPTGKVHPRALATLKRHGMTLDTPRSKSWDEFEGQRFDYILTVCDNAAGEACPLFQGPARRIHWSIPDPAHVTGTDAEIDAAFEKSFMLLKERIEAEFPVRQNKPAERQPKAP